jgi:hypothetical protein
VLNFDAPDSIIYRILFHRSWRPHHGGWFGVIVGIYHMGLAYIIILTMVGVPLQNPRQDTHLPALPMFTIGTHLNKFQVPQLYS